MGECSTVLELGAMALKYSSEKMPHDNTKDLEYLVYTEETLQHLNLSFKNIRLRILNGPSSEGVSLG